MIASGIDISPTAVALAARVRGGNPNRRCGGSACFSVGSATSIPFGAHAFDAIMSTDVLEHLQPHEMAPMVREFTRVARHRLFLHIALTPERTRQEVEKLHATSHEFDRVTTLHTTLRGRKVWLNGFARAGWSIDPAAPPQRGISPIVLWLVRHRAGPRNSTGTLQSRP